MCHSFPSFFDLNTHVHFHPPTITARGQQAFPGVLQEQGHPGGQPVVDQVLGARL